MNESKELEFFLNLISWAHKTCYEYISHLPEEALDWKLMPFTPSARWILIHIIKDQEWLAELICEKKATKEYNFTERYPKVDLEQLKGDYTKTMERIEKRLRECLKESDFNKEIDYKGYKISVKEALFEYVHHLFNHEGQIAQIITAWKRKQRAITE